MFTYQLSNNDCAFTSLKNLIATLNKDRRYLEIPSPYSYEYRMSFKDIVELANNYGITLNAFKNYSTEVIKDEKRPYLLLIRNISGANHLVMVKYLNKNLSKLYDPDLGKRLVSNRWLENNTVGNYLIVGSFEKRKCELKKVKLISNKKMTTYLLLEAFSLAMCLTGLYYINSVIPFYVSILILLGSLILSIISKVVILKYMQEFDNNYIGYTYDENVVIRSLNYQSLHASKKELFTFPLQILIYIVSALAVSTILILNEYYSLLAISLSIICAIINQYVLVPFEKKKGRKIAVLENELTSSELDKKTYISKFKESVQPTYLVGRLVAFKSFALLAAVVIGAFGISFLSGNHSLNYVLFYVFSGVFAFEVFDKLLNLLTNRKIYITSIQKMKSLIRKKNE